MLRSLRIRVRKYSSTYEHLNKLIESKSTNVWEAYNELIIKPDSKEIFNLDLCRKLVSYEISSNKNKIESIYRIKRLFIDLSQLNILLDSQCYFQLFQLLNIEEMVSLLEEMKLLKIELNPKFYNLLIKSYLEEDNMKGAKSALLDMNQFNLIPSIQILCKLLEKELKADIESANKLIRQYSLDYNIGFNLQSQYHWPRNIVQAFLSQYLLSNNIDGSNEWFNILSWYGISDSYALSLYIDYHFLTKRASKAEKIFETYLHLVNIKVLLSYLKGLKNSQLIVTYYQRFEHLIFDDVNIEFRTTISNIVIKAFISLNRLIDAIELFKSITPDSMTYLHMVEGLCKYNKLEKAIDLVNQLQFKKTKQEPELYFYIIDAAVKENKLLICIEFLDALNNLNYPNLAFYKITMMKLFNYLCSKECYEKAIEVYSFLKLNKYLLSPYEYAGLIKSISKSDILMSRKIFDDYIESNRFSQKVYLAMILAYSKNRDYLNMKLIFNYYKMHPQAEPDLAFYVNIMSAFNTLIMPINSIEYLDIIFSYFSMKEIMNKTCVFAYAIDAFSSLDDHKTTNKLFYQYINLSLSYPSKDFGVHEAYFKSLVRAGQFEEFILYLEKEFKDDGYVPSNGFLSLIIKTNFKLFDHQSAYQAYLCLASLYPDLRPYLKNLFYEKYEEFKDKEVEPHYLSNIPGVQFLLNIINKF